MQRHYSDLCGHSDPGCENPLGDQAEDGRHFVSRFYFIDTCIYYFTETKVLSIFYGHQPLYSVLVFINILVQYTLQVFHVKDFM